MHKILLYIDGSAESRFATEICWEIAVQTDSYVTAQHVIDSLAVWNFLSFSLAGLTGSGPFFSCHEEICRSMKKLGETLLEVYDCHHSSKDIRGNSVLDEGEVFSEIRKRAQHHSLLIIGHGKLSQDKVRQTKNSLLHNLPCPLLIVREPCTLWKKSRIIVSKEEIAQSDIKSILSFCKNMALEPEIYSVKDQKENWEDFLIKLTTSITPVDSTVPTYKFVEDVIMKVPQNTLLVMPVFNTIGSCMTAYSTDIEMLVQYLELPAILLWPVDRVKSGSLVNNRAGITYY